MASSPSREPPIIVSKGLFLRLKRNKDRSEGKKMPFENKPLSLNAPNVKPSHDSQGRILSKNQNEDKSSSINQDQSLSQSKSIDQKTKQTPESLTSKSPGHHPHPRHVAPRSPPPPQPQPHPHRATKEERHVPAHLFPPYVYPKAFHDQEAEGKRKEKEEKERIQKEIESIRLLVEEMKSLKEKLSKEKENEVEKIKQMAKNLYEREYKAPSHSLPCENEKIDCLKCYKDNLNNPLNCANLVRKYSKCSKIAQEKFVNSKAS